MAHPCTICTHPDRDSTNRRLSTARVSVTSPTRKLDRLARSIWVWDATEVPAGLTFNPPTLEPFRIPVR